MSNWTSPVTKSRPCARAACRKHLHRRSHEKDGRWEKRRFCSPYCSARCNGWGHKDPVRVDTRDAVSGGSA